MSASANTMAAAQYRRGALLVTGATVVWSSAGLLARLVSVDPWTTLFWRSVYAFVFLALYLLLRDGRGMPAAFARLGGVGVAMALCFAASMISFINALSLTTVAAVLVYQAAAPLFAAALAWLFLRERVNAAKLAAIAVSFAGVLLIVAGNRSPSGMLGNAVSFVMGLTYALTVVLARARPDVPTTEASLLAVAIVALVAAPLARFDLSAPDMLLLAVFGVFQMGLALILFTTGVRLIPAADAGLISVLESVLGPVLVWLAFGENPGLNTLLGGAVVIAAVVVAARLEIARVR